MSGTGTRMATLADSYRRDGYSKFAVGHGQKWINMTVKYMFVMGERRIAGFSHLYDFCHGLFRASEPDCELLPLN